MVKPFFFLFTVAGISFSVLAKVGMVVVLGIVFRCECWVCGYRRASDVCRCRMLDMDEVGRECVYWYWVSVGCGVWVLSVWVLGAWAFESGCLVLA